MNPSEHFFFLSLLQKLQDDKSYSDDIKASAEKLEKQIAAHKTTHDQFGYSLTLLFTNI